MPMEIWKDILEFKGLYQASSLGRIRSTPRTITRSNGRIHTVRSKVLKPAKDSNGYLRVGLIKEGKLNTRKVHRLVLSSFVHKEGKEVNHLDGVKDNNKLSNLEWVSRSENVKHAFKTGLATPLRGSKNPTSKIDEHQALTIKNYLKDGMGPTEISRIMKISVNICKDISRGKTWKIL